MLYAGLRALRSASLRALSHVAQHTWAAFCLVFFFAFTLPAFAFFRFLLASFVAFCLACRLAWEIPARFSAFLTNELRGPPSLDLPALPHALALKIFARIPVDTRLRCCGVNRAWRAMLSDTSFWEILDLSVYRGADIWPMLRAAVAKASGQLRALNITGQPFDTEHPFQSARILLGVVAANAATFTELRAITETWSAFNVQKLVEAACMRGPHPQSKRVYR